MNNVKNNDKLTAKFKKNVQQNEASDETIRNATQDLNAMSKRLGILKKKIKKCNSIEELNKIDELGTTSNDIGIIVSNSIIIDNISLRKRVEEINLFYRETEILYFNKKIELLNSKLDEKYKKSSEDLKEITGNSMFSIAAIFLGISLTSALVSGVEFIEKDFIILYFMTCLLIAVIVIGLASIFLRKFDMKTLVIMLIITIVSSLWLKCFKQYLPYINNNMENNISDNENSQDNSSKIQINVDKNSN